MSFTADKQTLDDLNMTGKFKSQSIYNFFNRVKTQGGGNLLDQMFHNPLSEPSQINKRSSIFQYFEKQNFKFPWDAKMLEAAENYLNARGNENLIATAIYTGWKKLLAAAIHDNEFDSIHQGLVSAIQMLQIFNEFITMLKGQNILSPYLDKLNETEHILNDRRLGGLYRERTTEQLSLFRVAKYNHLLKNVLRHEMEKILDVIYHLDVFISVGQIAKTEDFSYARALPKDDNILRAVELRHPGLNKAVGNPVSFHQESNVMFLTGANMAGKSTFMKSFGIAIYLAHMGFPVAAKNMEFSVKKGIYTSINVPDNLNLGYSHFYAEVLRVKKVAEEVSATGNMVVIFDELFKGTNVKDAYDATLAVTEAFSRYHNCFFIISTHIIEVGEELKDRCDHVQFAYLPTIMDGVHPRYTYQIEDGITADRHGMTIIENEKIVEIILS